MHELAPARASAPARLEAVCDAIEATMPGIVLAPPRLVRRVIKRDRDIHAIGLQVPHEHVYNVSLDQLRDQLLDVRELPLHDDLPDEIVLLPRPEPEHLEQAPAGVLLTRAWRAIFHARVDRAMDARLDALGAPESAARAGALFERIDAIGQSAFDEIRAVLRHEHRLLPPADDAMVWREFVALWLELRHFAPDMLDEYFPALADDIDAVDALIARDIDEAPLLAGSRPPGALDPDAARRLEIGPEEERPITLTGLVDGPAPPVAIETAVVRAELVAAAEGAGNFVRAAIVQVRATTSWHAVHAEGAPLATRRAWADAEPPGQRDLRQLASALVAALGEQGPSAAQWVSVLRPVLDHCGRGRLRQEARLLFDVQRLAVDHRRPTTTADVTGWLTSFGQRPIRRVQPAREMVNRVRFLRRARQRVRRLRLNEAQARDLSHTLDEAIAIAGGALRARYEPVLRDALREVGLEATNLPEQTARDKLVDELLDQLVERGFIDMGSVRDAISRNQLKMADLSGPGELVRGDALLQLDRRLMVALDGVYRRGEVYLRGLQRASSLAFATKLGRWLVLFVVLPFGAAYVALEGLQHIVGPIVHWLGGPQIHLMTPFSLTILGAYLLAVLHLPTWRRGSVVALRTAGRALHAMFVQLPRWVLRRRWVEALLGSWPAWVVKQFVIRPALGALMVWWIVPVLGAPPGLSVLAAVTLFLVSAVLLNTVLGRIMEEHLTDHAARSWRQLRHRLVPGIVRWTLAFFERMVDRFERVLYAVDERLRFRTGDPMLSLAFKATFGVVWAMITYLARIYVTLLIEPQVNPIKHFPVVTVSHKIILPLTLTLTELGARPLTPLLGPVIANAVVGFTVFLLPGVFGFLVWELKENWRLYAANRPRRLEKVRVGGHGESMLQLMRPGFHSGTLPRIFARMRLAERGRRGHRDRRALRKLRQDLHHVEQAVQTFVEREMLALIHASSETGLRLRVGHVALASNRVRIAIERDADGAEARPLRVSFTEQSGHLVAGLSSRGWLETLDEASLRCVHRALAGLYARAGVEYVREQLTAALPTDARFDIADDGLEVWLPDQAAPWLYDLDQRPRTVPQPTSPRLLDAEPPPALEHSHITFSRQPIPWSSWVRAWSTEPTGVEPPRVW